MALEEYKPRLLINDIDRGEKVLASVVVELSKCDEFMISVAFITSSGVTVLLNTLSDLEQRCVKGRIIASQYQNFTDPTALKRLLHFKNIELRIVTEDKANMHTKGCIFRKGEEYSIIVGSSNLTQNALCENKEWNLKVSSCHTGGIVNDIVSEFENMFELATPVDDNWLTAYLQIYHTTKESEHMAALSVEKKMIQFTTIYPNKMQVSALQSLSNLRSHKADRALIISATGTGKTYLSAFDVRNVNPKRFLFVVHRELIAKDALDSYKRVICNGKSMNLMSGGNKVDADYIFAMIQTLSKDEVLHQFRPDEFDYIVFDEVHRAGATSYQKVFNYFKPRFLLGISATPERTDGFDIFNMLDYNVAYEIRLQQAMKERMICPFHYFGISELTIDDKIIEDKTEFSKLTSDERVRNIIEKVEYYGYSGDRVKGLIFCSRKEEAIALSTKFNDRGYRTCTLLGIDSQSERESAIERLEQDDCEGALDYIFTVDIFNEGVDIPAVNQVVMLRPTQSTIIFIQQLGRGLRKKENKEYVVVIDFIGNYEKNFLIPIALSGDQTYNKDTIRRFVAEGNRIIPGCSTVNFDAVTRERIYASIDQANFNDSRLIKESYLALKQRLGRIPRLHEFAEYGSIDITRIFDKFGSYHNFLKHHDKEYTVELSTIESTYIKFISTKYANGKRPHELEFIKLLVDGHQYPVSGFKEVMKAKYPAIKLTEHTITCVLNQMMQNFATGSGKETYRSAVFVNSTKSGEYEIFKEFVALLTNNKFETMILDLIAVGLERNNLLYGNRYQDTSFQLYQKYTYDDVCKCLDWSQGEVPLNIGGYKFHQVTNTYPVFINYNKEDDIEDTIKYEDRFLSPSSLIAISKSGRSISSEDVQQALNARESGADLCLFVRKNKDDRISKEFYYLGRMFANGHVKEFVMPNTTSKAVEIGYSLQTPLRDDIYDYLVG
jgi:superfamily II DNA or RNA helicase/HKD family nuclease